MIKKTLFLSLVSLSLISQPALAVTGKELECYLGMILNDIFGSAEESEQTSARIIQLLEKEKKTIKDVAPVFRGDTDAIKHALEGRVPIFSSEAIALADFLIVDIEEIIGSDPTTTFYKQVKDIEATYPLTIKNQYEIDFDEPEHEEYLLPNVRRARAIIRRTHPEVFGVQEQLYLAIELSKKFKQTLATKSDMNAAVARHFMKIVR